MNKETLEYFEGDELAANVFIQKYALRDDNNNILESTPAQMFRRVAKEFARIENKKYNENTIIKPLTEDFIFDLIYNLFIIPQGSPLFGIGNDYQSVSLANCFVMHSPEDSYGSIMRTDEELVQLSKRRGGVGTDLSMLRPKGHPTKNAAKTSTGMATFMERYSNSINEVGQCIAKGEQVLSKRGLINIEDVIPNEDYVWTKKGWVKVINIFKNGKKEIRRVTTKNGYTIKTSKDHLFQTSFKGELTETRLRDLFVDDEVVMCLGEYDENDSKPYIGLNNQLYEKYDNNKTPDGTLPCILDEKLAYLIGYLYGNGYTDEYRSLGIVVPDNKPNILNKLVNIIRDKFNINANIDEGDGACKIISIRNKRIIDFLNINNILKEKSKHIKVPESILIPNRDVQLAFVSGYFDADGNATNPKKSGYRMSSISFDFLKTTQQILSSNGIASKISKEDRSHKENWNDLYTLRIVGTHSQTELVELAKESLKIQETSFVSKRDCIISPYYAKNINVKSSRYSYCCGENTLSLGCLDKLQKDGIDCNTRLFNDKIVSIEIADEFEETFDLELESEHLFWCNGFYVHNSNRRGALMMSIDVKHPDILEFVTIKNDRTKVTGANISVRLSDEFMEAVKTNSEFELCFPIDWKERGLKIPTVSKIVNANEIWDVIVKNAHENAEPGLLFWDTIIKNSPADCYSKFGYKTTSTNPSLRHSTLVLTSEGVYPIKELADNKRNIIVRNILGQWEQAIAFKSGENKKLYEIVFTNGQRLFATEEHKHPIFNTSGNIINKQTGHVIKKKTLELKRGDKFYLPNFSEHPINVSDTLSNDDGFACGWLTGDGSITDRKDSRRQYSFTFSKEDYENGICDRVSNYINSKTCEDKPNFKIFERQSTFECSTSSVCVDEYFKNIGIEHKSNGLPDIIWKSNHNFINGYIDGLFSSDGYFDAKNSRIILTSVHEKLINDVRKLLGFYGIKCNLTTACKETNFSKNGQKFTRFDLIINNKHAEIFSNNFSISNTRKKEALIKLLENVDVLRNKLNSNLKNERNYLVVKEVIDNNIIEDVYDITVYDDTHTFQIECGITGNCGEIPLSPLDSCRLLLLNLSKYIDNKFTSQARFNKELFIEHTKIAQRLMDDLVDLEEEKIEKIIYKIENEDPEPLYIRQNEIEIWKKVKKSLLNGRRTGLGMNAVGDAIAFLNLRYGSPESLDFIDEVFKNFRDSAYLSSIEMARDLGSFPIFESIRETENIYLNRMWNTNPDLKLMYLKYGRRNISLLTLSPSGSVSCLTRTTSGVEPVFRATYTRRKKINDDNNDAKCAFIDQNGVKFEEFKVYHPQLKKYLDEDSSRTEETSPWWDSTSDKINWVDSVKMQAIMQKYIDHSISRTVNLPSTATKEDISKIYLTAWEQGCKGITVYRDGSRSGILVTEDSINQNNNFTKKNDGVKRPEELRGEVHRIKIKDEEFVVVVGLMENQPYEIFVNTVLDDCSEVTKQLSEETNETYEYILTKYNIPKNIKTGKIIKIKRGVYKFISDKGDEYIISGYVESDEVESLARMVSLGLRHKIDLSYVVHGLEKNKGFFNFPKAMARTLKKYIPKGTKVSGESCPNCGGENLMRQDGCVLCGDCGWTKC